MALIVVSGALANKPRQGGEAWVRLSYLRGLGRLGHRVHFVEQIDPGHCTDAQGSAAELEESINRVCFDDVVRSFGFEDSATLIPVAPGSEAAIPPHLFDLADSADALLNISGHLSVAPLFGRFRRRTYIDIDPGYTQYWHADGGSGARLQGHDHYFTIGENVGRSDCPIPTSGIRWQATRPPVVLEDWPCLAPSANDHRFTTVANWRGAFGRIQIGERAFGLKAHEFRKVLPLPQRRPEEFEIALRIHPGDRQDEEALRSSGWRLTDPDAAATPEGFRSYVQCSGAEFSVAQGIYVETQSGWFSDRTVRYLATGRPALVQETGFSRHLPVGEGLVPFRTLDEAVSGTAAIAADYESHCRAARSIAERCFDSDRILGRLLEEIGITP